MTWTPADGPSRRKLQDEIANIEYIREDVEDPNSLADSMAHYRAALAAHVLYEENQRLREHYGEALLQLDEARRDTERLDWLDHQNADLDLGPYRDHIDRQMANEAAKGDTPSEHRKGEG